MFASWKRVGAGALCVTVAVACASAQEGESGEIPGPRYFDLRYDDDFSYLDGATESYLSDFFDPFKNIHLSDDWLLSIGGQFRFRLESETNKAFGTNARTNDTFTLYRQLLHFDLKYQDWFRVFVEGIHAFDEDRDLIARGTDENKWDLHQLFVDFRIPVVDHALTVRVGRQELQYGNLRYVTGAEWDNVRQRFDAVKLFTSGESWDFDVWYARPVPVRRKSFDDGNEQVDFYGAYTTYKGWQNRGLDMYFFAIDDTGAPVNPNGNSGDRDLYMLGARYWGEHGPFDFEAELAGQWGHWAGDTIQAWSWSVYGGYTMADWSWQPRIGFGFDWASGDDDSTDSSVGTTSQLFGDGHKWFGALDLIGRQNITSANVNLTLWPVADKVTTQLTYFAFWLTEEEDALYSAGGAAIRRDPFGDSGDEVGHELDWTINWMIDAHSSVLVGWSHFWDSNFITATGASDDPDLIYVQYQFKF